MMTDTTAAAPMYHQSPDCKNSTAPPALRGPDGIRPATIALAPAMSTTAESTRPTRPTAAMPSPALMRVAMSAPRMNSASTAMPRLIHIT